MTKPLFLLTLVTLMATAMAQDLYHAVSTAATSCKGISDGCVQNVPGCPDDGCNGQQSWSVPSPFGGVFPTTAWAPSGKLNTNENTDWIIFKGFTGVSGQVPSANATRLGMGLTFWLDPEPGTIFQVPADALRVRIPGSFYKKTLENNPETTIVAVTVPVSTPGSSQANPNPNPATDRWVTDTGQNLDDFPLGDAEFGFAVFVKHIGGNKKRIRFVTAEMRVWSIIPGQQTDPPTAATNPTGPQTTTGPGGSTPPPPGTTEATLRQDKSQVGIIVGAVIGGLIVAAGVTVLIIFLVRRAAAAQPSVRLDAPLTNYQTF